MRSPARFLQSSDPLRKAEPPSLLPVDSDVVVVLAALLCALISVIGLAIVARCAWIRRSSTSSSSSSAAAPPLPPSKGLKKKVLRALPTLSFDSSATAGGVELVECAICLTEFADGDDVRVLPQCGHGFHACCVDTWLRSHSSCPSCRQVLVVPAPPSRCHSCGAASGGAAAGAKTAERGGASTLPH
ncbi:hypothetical protein B296_00005666 [Ensete ventricosum]|uniref:RING-type E3 ubiquitin transferase n=1 Tax=Ensete ventricosum TaxID=4639 RepID=A0A426ZZ93_ENSVE|nr:hypothetical protein B296_00005666 [Ensete ventricosum]